MRNLSGQLFASAARTTLQDSATITNQFGRGVRIDIDVTAGTAGFSVTPEIDVLDPVSGVFTAILTGAAITGASHVVMIVYPGCIAVSNLVANLPIGKFFKFHMAVADSKSVTYSVSYQLLQ